MGGNPLYLMVPATINCCHAFMLPVGTPCNAMVISATKIETSYMVGWAFYSFCSFRNKLKKHLFLDKSWNRHQCFYTPRYMCNDCCSQSFSIQLRDRNSEVFSYSACITWFKWKIKDISSDGITCLFSFCHQLRSW